MEKVLKFFHIIFICGFYIFSYRILSFKRRGIYKIPKALGAAFIGGKRLLEGGVYIFVNISLHIRKVIKRRIKNRSYFIETVNKIKKVQIIKPVCPLLLRQCSADEKADKHLQHPNRLPQQKNFLPNIHHEGFVKLLSVS